MAMRAGVVVMSGPSGTGKTSIVKALLKDERVGLSVSATTRPPRPKEVDGVDYYFHSREEFERLCDAGELAEWAEVYGQYYGTPAAPLREASQRSDAILILDIDVQGAAQIRESGIEAYYVFIAPPSLEELRRRLEARGTDTAEVIERRLSFARGELDRRHLYDHVVVNRELPDAIAEAKRVLGIASPG